MIVVHEKGARVATLKVAEGASDKATSLPGSMPLFLAAIMLLAMALLFCGFSASWVPRAASLVDTLEERPHRVAAWPAAIGQHDL